MENLQSNMNDQNLVSSMVMRLGEQETEISRLLSELELERRRAEGLEVHAKGLEEDLSNAITQFQNIHINKMAHNQPSSILTDPTVNSGHSIC